MDPGASSEAGPRKSARIEAMNAKMAKEKKRRCQGCQEVLPATVALGRCVACKVKVCPDCRDVVFARQRWRGPPAGTGEYTRWTRWKAADARWLGWQRRRPGSCVCDKMACNVQFAKVERSMKESDLELCLECDLGW